MSILTVIVVVLAVGVLMWAVHKYGTEYVHPPFLKIADVVAIVGTLIWLGWVIGLWDYLGIVRIGRMRS